MTAPKIGVLVLARTTSGHDDGPYARRTGTYGPCRVEGAPARPERSRPGPGGAAGGSIRAWPARSGDWRRPGPEIRLSGNPQPGTGRRPGGRGAGAGRAGGGHQSAADSPATIVSRP